LKGLNYAPSSINQKLSAIRKLAVEASDNGLIDSQLASGVTRVKGVKSAGVRVGNWLTKDQAEFLINSTDKTTLKGLRDRAILAVMIGGGLRRSEVSGLTFDHIQQREGRWVIADLVGKGNRVRTVPIASWVKVAIDQWTETANFKEGRLFRSINRGDNISGDSMTSQSIQDVVKFYDALCGFGLQAHDLRRTYAKLARKGGADLMQIQLSLGHASLKTTERYLGEIQDLTSAPGDFLGIRLDE
jgi:site-specific recombinase XerD